MLNTGTLFTLAALSLVALGQSQFSKSPAATAPTPQVAPIAPIQPMLVNLSDDQPADAGSAIADAIKEIESNQELSAETKERIISRLRKAQAEIDAHRAPIAPRIFHFDEKSGTAPKASRDMRIRVQGKDGKVYELHNPSESELKEFQEKMRKEFSDMRLDFNLDSKELDQLRKSLGDMKFDFKIDPEFMEKFGKDLKFDAKELKRMRDDIHRIAPRSTPSTRTDIQRELEEIQRERAELDARERALKDQLNRTKSAQPTSAV